MELVKVSRKRSDPKDRPLGIEIAVSGSVSISVEMQQIVRNEETATNIIKVGDKYFCA